MKTSQIRELNWINFFRKTCRVQCAIARCTHCSYNVQCHPFLIFYGRLKPRRRRYWIFVVDTLVVVNLELIASLDTSRYITYHVPIYLIISSRHHWRFEFQLSHSNLSTRFTTSFVKKQLHLSKNNSSKCKKYFYSRQLTQKWQHDLTKILHFFCMQQLDNINVNKKM